MNQRKLVPSLHPVKHWVFVTPVGEFDRHDSAIKACRNAGLKLGGGDNINAELSDSPVAKTLSTRRR